uniref:Intraflagellar transport protein 52 n=1 Tax=Syphacia muris TaxID=451379 RepID=A0A0N5AMB8_9BILA
LFTDSVIRTIFHKYFEPKEALIFDGILNRAVFRCINIAKSLTLLYPFGCTLTVDKRSVAVLSTGSACYPLCQPICAFHKTKDKNGKLVVVGSVQMFTDTYVDKEKNLKIWDFIVKFVTEDIKMNELDSSDPDITDKHYIPNHIQLSEQVKVCLQECDFDTGESSNFMNLFDTSLYSIDLSKWAKAIRTYEEVGLDHEPLSLIVPQFQVPLPPLEPAVFPPEFGELEPPKLELFDLDEMFATTETRIARLANKCGESDCEYFLKEAAEILDITHNLSTDNRDPKRILEYILVQIAEFKKLNQALTEDELQTFHAGLEHKNDLSDIDELD